MLKGRRAWPDPLFETAYGTGEPSCRHLKQCYENIASDLQTVALLRFLLHTHNEQESPGRQNQPSDDGWEGNVFVSVCRGVNRTDIDNLFASRITKSLVDESQPSENNEQNSQHGDRFHVFSPRSGNQPSALDDANEDESNGKINRMWRNPPII